MGLGRPGVQLAQEMLSSLEHEPTGSTLIKTVKYRRFVSWSMRMLTIILLDVTK